MNLIVDTPADFVVQLLSQWLTLCDICDLEEAMCSVENRLRLGTLYEALVLGCDSFVGSAENAHMQLDWLVVRRIRVSSLRVEYLLPGISLPKITALLKHSSTSLRVLNINDNDAALGTIAAAVSVFCTELKVLEVSSMALCASFFTMLGSLRNLQCLRVFQCERLNAEHINGVSCPSIKSLTLSGNYSVRVQEELLKMCSKIETYHFSIEGYAELQDMPSTLVSMFADNCRAVDIVNLNANLKTIMITGNGIADETIAGMFTSCRSVQELILPSKDFLTDETALKIGDTYGHSLTVLNLYEWQYLSRPALKYICEKCLVLNNLTLGGRDSCFDPTHVIIALDNCPSLRTLRLICTTLPDEVLVRIAAASLEFLDLRSVGTISDIGIMALVNGCAMLTKITVRDEFFSPLMKMMWNKVRPDLEIEEG